MISFDVWSKRNKSMDGTIEKRKGLGLLSRVLFFIPPPTRITFM